ncbi:hypothetical protein KY347_06165 [Candidatus Woesearchaeota archaeon]|nr:hypothetical protein [Candidatus Woesearchaeota archaeon]
MKISLANKFLFIGVLLYTLAGIAAISKINYSMVILSAAVIFLAFGLFANMMSKCSKLPKKKR